MDEEEWPMTSPVLERYLSTTEQVYDKDTGKLISNALSIRTLTNQEVLMSTITYSSASPVESKVIVYKLLHNKKG
jgi:hypothetical protein